MGKHTPGPWFVGAQNDALYIVAGRAPSPDNDYPMHDAKRVAVAKVYEATDNDALPVDATANAKLLAAAPSLLEALELLQGMDFRLQDDAHGAEIRRRALDAIRKATA